MIPCTGPVRGTCPRSVQIQILTEKPCPHCPNRTSVLHWGTDSFGYTASDRDDTDTDTIRKG
jgi:hypothetical protein